MIRLIIAAVILAVIADHYGFLPIEISNILDSMGAEIHTYFQKTLQLIEDYAINLALTLIGLCLITLMDII